MKKTFALPFLLLFCLAIGAVSYLSYSTSTSTTKSSAPQSANKTTDHVTVHSTAPSEVGAQPLKSDVNTPDKGINSSMTATAFDPTQDYTYSSETLTTAMRGLHTLNEQRKNGLNISQEQVLKVWENIDAAVAENTISPVESIKHKQWLAGLVESPTLTERFETEAKHVEAEIKAASEIQVKATSADPKFIAYKAEEKRLTQEILAMYPDDGAKAAAELGKALDKRRAEIYHAPSE